MEGDRGDSVVVGDVVLDKLVRPHVPHIDLAVRAAGDDAVAIVVEQYLAHSAR